ncbi:MAG: hypothetical protein A3G41_05885 [Elusimicrobia bacterium RIFCSPLOWO2_12_FULL_59_9]|nr:MAG: hypothetical protein A3G41_05885 [Elusimicrobia bacterium RIFCSPLOWO2_12_FULL_59_9]
MPQKTEERPIIAEQVFELRHEAAGKFLDVRGFVADYLRKQKFPHWRIETNSISFHDGKNGIEKDGALVGYKSVGYFVHNPDTKNYFADKAIAFWDVLLKNGHYDIPEPRRFGVRTKIFLPLESEFTAINKRIYDTFVSAEGVKVFGGTPTDLQITLDIDEGEFTVHCMLGPLEKNEATRWFPFDSEKFESAGIYLDLDVATTKDLKLSNVPSLIKRASTLIWGKLDMIEESLKL